MQNFLEFSLFEIQGGDQRIKFRWIILISVPCIFYYFVQWPTKAQLIYKLSHYSYMFLRYCAILRDFNSIKTSWNNFKFLSFKLYYQILHLTCRVLQQYLTISQHSCEWNRWRGEFDLERPSGETQSISVAMERWSEEHRAFAVETYC